MKFESNSEYVMKAKELKEMLITWRDYVNDFLPDDAEWTKFICDIEESDARQMQTKVEEIAFAVNSCVFGEHFNYEMYGVMAEWEKALKSGTLVMYRRALRHTQKEFEILFEVCKRIVLENLYDELRLVTEEIDRLTALYSGTVI